MIDNKKINYLLFHMFMYAMFLNNYVFLDMEKEQPIVAIVLYILLTSSVLGLIIYFRIKSSTKTVYDSSKYIYIRYSLILTLCILYLIPYISSVNSVISGEGTDWGFNSGYIPIQQHYVNIYLFFFIPFVASNVLQFVLWKLNKRYKKATDINFVSFLVTSISAGFCALCFSPVLLITGVFLDAAVVLLLLLALLLPICIGFFIYISIYNIKICEDKLIHTNN